MLYSKNNEHTYTHTWTNTTHPTEPCPTMPYNPFIQWAIANIKHDWATYNSYANETPQRIITQHATPHHIHTYIHTCMHTYITCIRSYIYRLHTFIHTLRYIHYMHYTYPNRNTSHHINTQHNTTQHITTHHATTHHTTSHHITYMHACMYLM